MAKINLYGYWLELQFMV